MIMTACACDAIRMMVDVRPFGDGGKNRRRGTSARTDGF
jgi:hypothetical protein